jgi:hypothetical protein
MGVSFTSLVYLPNYDVWSVPVTFWYATDHSLIYARGIFDTDALNVPGEDGSIYSDQQTILDIREAEFGTLPKQGDHIDIPRDCNGVDQGEWEIIDRSSNGGGETTLVLRKWMGTGEITRARLIGRA